MKNIINPVIPLWIILLGGLIFLGLLCFLMKRNEYQIKEIIFTCLRVALILLLFAAIDARYMVAKKDAQVAARNLDIVFVIDNTLSMYADDNSGKKRSENAKEICSYIMNEIQGANYGVIVFDNTAQIYAPFTQDISTIDDVFSSMHNLNVVLAKGTSLNYPYEKMEELLKSSAKKEDRKAIVFFLSDGEITKEVELRSYKELSSYIYGGAVLGFGTEKGSYIEVKAPYPYSYKHYYVTDKNHHRAITKMNENTLKKIASDLRIDYIHPDSVSDLDGTVKQILKISEKTLEGSQAIVHEDTYFYWTIPLVLLLMMELAWFVRKRRV